MDIKCKVTLPFDRQLNSDAIIILYPSHEDTVDPHIKFMSKFQSTVIWLSLPRCLIIVCAVAENTCYRELVHVTEYINP